MSSSRSSSNRWSFVHTQRATPFKWSQALCSEKCFFVQALSTDGVTRWRIWSKCPCKGGTKIGRQFLTWLLAKRPYRACSTMIPLKSATLSPRARCMHTFLSLTVNLVQFSCILGCVKQIRSWITENCPTIYGWSYRRQLGLYLTRRSV